MADSASKPSKQRQLKRKRTTPSSAPCDATNVTDTAGSPPCQDKQEGSPSKRSQSNDLLHVGDKPMLLLRSKPDDAAPRSKPAICKVNSDLLSKLPSFLTELAKANTDLEQKMKEQDPSQYRVEDVSDEEGPYIEMDIACGILEQLSPTSVEQKTQEFLSGENTDAPGIEEL